MQDTEWVNFLQWALPQLRMRWPGFRKVRRQVCKRVGRRLQQLGLPGVGDYRDYLERHPSEWLVLDDLCRISISRFYRDRQVFDLLKNQVLPKLAATAISRGDQAIRAWSAGCASGEEVYTLKLIWEIVLKHRFPSLRLQLTATDADLQLLDRARRGCYPASSLKDFPADWIPMAFHRTNEEFWLRDEFRGGIAFLLQDIRRQQPKGPFDLICCRHLAFTYFDLSLQAEVLRHLLDRLEPAGVLVTGKQEILPDIAHPLVLVEPHSGIYRRS